MGANFPVFLGVAALVIVMPGPDTAVVTKNVLLHGRRAGLGTSLGVSTGLMITGFGAPLCCRHAVYEMNWLGALLEWQFLLRGTLCPLHLDLSPRLILSRLD